MIPVAIVGGGGHARVLAGILKSLKRDFSILGYTDKDDRGPLLGLPYLGNDAALTRLLREHGTVAAAIGVGFSRTPSPRRMIQRDLERMGLMLPAIVSGRALIGEAVTIGAAVQVFDGAVVSPGATLSEGVILNSGSIVEHDVFVGPFTHVAPGAVIAGGVQLGADVLIGANATVLPGLVVAPGCIVGAGAVVARSLESPGVYAGVPARRIH